MLNVFKSVSYLATIRMQSGTASRSYSQAKVIFEIDFFINERTTLPRNILTSKYPLMKLRSNPKMITLYFTNGQMMPYW